MKKKHLLAEVFIRKWIKYKIWPTIEVAEGVVSTNKSCWQHCPCCHLPITAMHMENDVLFCMYLSFRWKYFHENSCLLFSTHALHTLHVLFPSVNNERHFA